MKSKSDLREIGKALDTLLLDMCVHQATVSGQGTPILKVLFEGWFSLSNNHINDAANKIGCKRELEDFIYNTFEPFTADSRLVGVRFIGYERGTRFYAILARLPFKSEYTAYVLKRFNKFYDSKRNESIERFVFD